MVDSNDDAFFHQYSCTQTFSAPVAVARARLTKWVEIELDRKVLLDGFEGVAILVEVRSVDGQGIKPDPDLVAAPAPERILECADPRQVRPIEFDVIGQDLQVILDLLIRGTLGSQEHQLTVNQEDDGGIVEVVSRISEALL